MQKRQSITGVSLNNFSLRETFTQDEDSMIRHGDSLNSLGLDQHFELDDNSALFNKQDSDLSESLRSTLLDVSPLTELLFMGKYKQQVHFSQ